MRRILIPIFFAAHLGNALCAGPAKGQGNFPSLGHVISRVFIDVINAPLCAGVLNTPNVPVVTHSIVCAPIFPGVSANSQHFASVTANSLAASVSVSGTGASNTYIAHSNGFWDDFILFNSPVGAPVPSSVLFTGALSGSFAGNAFTPACGPSFGAASLMLQLGVNFTQGINQSIGTGSVLQNACGGGPGTFALSVPWTSVNSLVSQFGGLPYHFSIGAQVNALLLSNLTTAAANYANTGLLTGARLFDSQGVDITNYYSVTTGGGVNLNPTVTPEPASIILVATGLLGLGAGVRRQRRRTRSCKSEFTSAQHA